MRRPQGGAALLLTIWVLLLLSILVGSTLLIARAEALRARQMHVQAEARQAADGGIRAAVLVLSSDDTARTLEGQGLTLAIGGFEVNVAVSRESGKIDVNLAAPELIAELLLQLGHPGDLASLTLAINKWRAPGGARAGSTAALLAVPEIDPAIAGCASAYLTVVGGPEPDLVHAAPIVVQAVRAARGASGMPLVTPSAVAGATPAAGQLFAISAAASQDQHFVLARTAVVRITGSPRKPFLAHSWVTSGFAGAEACAAPMPPAGR